MKYGSAPKVIGHLEINCDEFMVYQYLPIKMKNATRTVIEPRLNCFRELITIVYMDFMREFGSARFNNSYVYITIKNLYQVSGCSFNRKGYHSDGFMTNDINYIWSNADPTVFNIADFNLTMHDIISMNEMERQAKPENEIVYENNSLLRLDQFNIHKVAENTRSGVRTFVKMSFSEDKYDLIGNSHNYKIKYNWEMRERKISRNIPQDLM